MTAPAHPRISYDTVPYPTFAQRQTHPDRLAVQATLLGMTPAPVERCRVLEIACGDGSNLVPMAFHLPGSEFVGVDRAGAPIERARGMAADLGLGNVRFLRCDLAELPADLGSFDYVIAHGVYSWVPPEVQDALLAACHRHLSARGIGVRQLQHLPGQPPPPDGPGDDALPPARGGRIPPASWSRASPWRASLPSRSRAPTPTASSSASSWSASSAWTATTCSTTRWRSTTSRSTSTSSPSGPRAMGCSTSPRPTSTRCWTGGSSPRSRKTLGQLGSEPHRARAVPGLPQVPLLPADPPLPPGDPARPLAPTRAGPPLPDGRPLPPGDGRRSTSTGGRPERFVHPQGASLRTDWPVAKAALLLLGERWPRALPFDGAAPPFAGRRPGGGRRPVRAGRR